MDNIVDSLSVANRKFLDISAYADMCNLGVKYDDGDHTHEIYLNPISEYEIVRPYLEKILSEIENIEINEHILPYNSIDGVLVPTATVPRTSKDVLNDVYDIVEQLAINMREVQQHG